MANDDANTTTTDQLTLQDPTKRYPVITPPEDSLPGTGLDAEMTPKADLGEKSYRGTGRLQAARRSSRAATPASARRPRSPSPARAPTS